MKKVYKSVVICIVVVCFFGACLSLGNFSSSTPRKAWTVSNYSNAPDDYYMIDTSSGTQISRSEYSTPPYIRDFSKITDFMFSEDGLSFITSDIIQTLRNNTFNVILEYPRSSSSIPITKIDLVGYVRSTNDGKWRISIDYSDKLKDFLLNMPENFSQGCYVKVYGIDRFFYFDFPNKAIEFKEAWKELEQMKTKK